MPYRSVFFGYIEVAPLLPWRNMAELSTTLRLCPFPKFFLEELEQTARTKMLAQSIYCSNCSWADNAQTTVHITGQLLGHPASQMVTALLVSGEPHWFTPATVGPQGSDNPLPRDLCIHYTVKTSKLDPSWNPLICWLPLAPTLSRHQWPHAVRGVESQALSHTKVIMPRCHG